MVNYQRVIHSISYLLAVHFPNVVNKKSPKSLQEGAPSRVDISIDKAHDSKLTITQSSISTHGNIHQFPRTLGIQVFVGNSSISKVWCTQSMEFTGTAPHYSHKKPGFPYDGTGRSHQPQFHGPNVEFLWRYGTPKNLVISNIMFPI